MKTCGKTTWRGGLKVHNQITISAAQKIIGKIDSANVPLALFKVGYGSWQATRTNTQFFNDKLRQRPDHLIGVYDCNVTMEELCDDLSTMGVK